MNCLVGGAGIENRPVEDVDWSRSGVRQQYQLSSSVSGSGVGGSSEISNGNVSDGKVGWLGRSVHTIDENVGSSAKLSPNSSDLFDSKLRAHYRKESRVV